MVKLVCEGEEQPIVLCEELKEIEEENKINKLSYKNENQ